MLKKIKSLWRKIRKEKNQNEIRIGDTIIYNSGTRRETGIVIGVGEDSVCTKITKSNCFPRKYHAWLPKDKIFKYQQDNNTETIQSKNKTEITFSIKKHD